MCLWRSLLAALCVVAVCSPVFGGTPPLTDEEQRLLEKIRSKKDKRQAALQLLNQNAKRPNVDQHPVAALPTAPTATSRPILQSPTGNLDPLPTLPHKNETNISAPQQYSACPGLNLLLRQDWNDIGYLNCPQPVEDATGAQISFTDDRAANNRVTAIHGTAALVYNSVTGTPQSPLAPYDTSLGAYVTVNRAFNSSAAQSKSNADKLAYGGLAELGFDTSTGANYFRVRGGGVENHLKNTTAANITGEWLPVYTPLNIHYPFRPLGVAPFIVRFDPVLLVQYTTVAGKNQLLDFNNRSEAFRIGPQLTMNLFPLPGSPALISRLSGSIT